MKELNALLTYGLKTKLILNLEQAKQNLITLFKTSNFTYEENNHDIDETPRKVIRFCL